VSQFEELISLGAVAVAIRDHQMSRQAIANLTLVLQKHAITVSTASYRETLFQILSPLAEESDAEFGALILLVEIDFDSDFLFPNAILHFRSSKKGEP
jgi:hypothetical protein